MPINENKDINHRRDVVREHNVWTTHVCMKQLDIL